jgi:hypothetical protein
LLCKNFFYIMFFCKFLDFHTFYNSFCLCFSCKFLHFSSALSSFMLQHTSQNTKSFWNNFECEETDFHSLLLFVLFRASHCFCINCLFFFQTPHSFHDGHILLHPQGSRYYPPMGWMHSNILHSSICHCHHLPFHPSSSLPCVL